VFAGDYSSAAQMIPTTLTNVTITNNSATGPGAITGGLQQVAGTITGSLVAGNTDPGGNAPDCYGGPTSGGGNLIGDIGAIETCSFTGPNDLVGAHGSPIVPNVGTLVDNGGPTRTIALNPGSPAINRGGTCPDTDQRGFFRPPAAPCDAGAFEVGAPS